jgi:parallel beta-helix repeat protein
MKRTVYRVACLILVCVVLLGLGGYSNVQAAGSVYYVSTTGNDANSGTASAPFKTFAKANSMLSAGSTLYIYAGIYNQQLKISKSGLDTARITVKPVSGAVVIDLKNTLNPVLNLPGSYITINNLDIRGSNDICVRLAGKYLRVSGLVVHECQTHGIYVSGQHIDITNNSVYAASLVNQSRTLSSGWGSGIKIGLGGDDVLVDNNTVYHNYGEGIAATRGSNVVIQRNTVYDNFSVNIYVDNSFNTHIEKNLVTCHTNTGFERNGNPASGIAMGEEFYDGWGAQLKNLIVTNNIVAFCRRGVYYFDPDPTLIGGGFKNSTVAYNTLWASTDTALGIMYGSGQTGSLVANNIIWQTNNKLAYIENSAGLTFQNNLWKVTPPSNVKGNGDRIGDPRFSTTPSYTADTYNLSSSSPAIGGALNIGIATDYFGHLRGPSYEMGALQFSGSVTSQNQALSNEVVLPTATSIPTKTAVPTETSTQIPTSTSQPTLIPTNTPTSTLLPPTPTSTGAVIIP